MKILDRYVTWNVLITGFFAIAVLSVVLVLGNVFKQLLELLVNHDAPVDLILSFIAYILPFSFTFTIPWGFLTSVLLVFGKMSAENELIALRSNGISIPRICIPVLALAVVCVSVCLWINLIVAPRAQAKMKDALYKIATSNPLSMFESDKVISEFPGYKIYVARNEGARLYNLLVYKLNEDSTPMQVISARDGWLETDGANKRMLLHIYNGRFEQRDEQNPADLSKIRQGITMEESTLPISLEELYRRQLRTKGPSTYEIGALLERLSKNDPGTTEKQKAIDRTATMTEINKRYSFSLASFAFGLFGVPLAITAHRKETAIGFLMSMLVAFSYFLFIIVADTLRNRPPAHPEWLVWSPNVVFIAIGAILFFRLSRR